MQACFTQQETDAAIPIVPLRQPELGAWRDRQAAHVHAWLDATGFKARPDNLCLVPGADGGLAVVLLGIESPDDPWCLGSLPCKLPPGDYVLQTDWSESQLRRACIGWGAGAYRFQRYIKASDTNPPRLCLPGHIDAAQVKCHARALALVRDLINTPAVDMMPADLAAATQQLAATHGAEYRELVGEQLLEANYPVIHAVGRASSQAPRLLDFSWGEPTHPRLTLIGKGVCFDSGGLDLKPASNMRIMKKDMGGAAHVLGLAEMILSAHLPVRLRVLIPAVENAVSGNAFRPGDVLNSRQGISIEVDNTDAEGRLVLCDALAEAGTDAPDLIIDFATLTGAARIALGTEVPAFFTHSESLANDLMRAAETTQEPIWRLPLHKPYRRMLKSNVADIMNSAAEPYGGAITAALFLHEFVAEGTDWAHFDIMGWNLRGRPGRPVGGEAMGLRAVFEALSKRYG